MLPSRYESNGSLTRPSSGRRVRSLVACLLGLLGCGDDAPNAQSMDPVTVDDDAGALPSDVCERATAGTPCGQGLHCVAGLCVENLCGDGVKAGEELCDDGNQQTGDGCTPSCQLRPVTCGDATLDDGEECDDGNWFDVDACSNDCTKNECGNSREDAREECDDGNLVSDDACSNECTENRCRNGRLDPGEECDDGNREHNDGCSNGCLIVECGNGKTDGAERGGREECDDGNGKNDDACSNECTSNVCGNARLDPGEVCDGDTSQYTCSDDCREKSGNSGCNTCREQYCRAFAPDPTVPQDNFDVLAGCLENEDAEFRTQCLDVIDCARTNRCGYGDPNTVDATQCFCGNADISACQTPGVASGACQPEWRAAARSEALADVLGNFYDFSLPSGMAYYLMLCESRYCLDECAP